MNKLLKITLLLTTCITMSGCSKELMEWNPFEKDKPTTGVEYPKTIRSFKPSPDTPLTSQERFDFKVSEIKTRADVAVKVSELRFRVDYETIIGKCNGLQNQLRDIDELMTAKVDGKQAVIDAQLKVIASQRDTIDLLKGMFKFASDGE